MKLTDFLTNLSMSPERFVAEHMPDVSKGAFRKWLSGERIPRKDQMEKIFEVTGGKVTPNDFYEIGGQPERKIAEVAE